MKLNFNIFAIVCLLLAGVSSLAAQTAVSSGSSVDDRVAKFMQRFQDAYNQADAAAVGSLFTSDAERIDTEGTATTGSTQIADQYAKAFQSGKWMLVVRAESSTQLADGTIVATGSYKATGTKADGTTEVRTGTFRNELTRKNKELLIRRMKLFKSL
jgi:uncharacterized protein (TIGR02246 family)